MKKKCDHTTYSKGFIMPPKSRFAPLQKEYDDIILKPRSLGLSKMAKDKIATDKARSAKFKHEGCRKCNACVYRFMCSPQAKGWRTRKAQIILNLKKSRKKGAKTKMKAQRKGKR